MAPPASRAVARSAAARQSHGRANARNCGGPAPASPSPKPTGYRHLILQNRLVEISSRHARRESLASPPLVFVDVWRWSY
jgi:hypothetical protein